MTYLAIGLVVVWLGGLLYLAGVHLNDVRLVHNNFAAGERPAAASPQFRSAPIAAAALVVPFILDFALAAAWLLSGRQGGRERFSIHFATIDRSQLTESGRVFFEKALLHERIFFAWIVAAILPIICVGYLLATP